MEELHITTVGLLHPGEVLIELSDGRTVTFSLEKLLTLVPDAVVTAEDVKREG